jgi:DnaJ-class molecular chaperone
MSKIDLKMNIEYVCVECNGDGKEVVKKITTCNNCKGIGYIFYKNYRNETDSCNCPTCKGKGSFYTWTDQPCSYCRGRGYRSWIDYIVRPSQKEKEVCNV